MVPLVLLHGFLGGPGDWGPVLQALDTAELRPRAWTPRVPPDPDCRALSLAAIADALETAARGGGHTPAVLVGYSLGGRVALHWATRHPGSIRAVVAISANPGLDDPAERAERAAADTARAHALRADPEAFLRAWYRAPMWGYDLPAAERAAARRSGFEVDSAARILEDLSPGRQPSVWHALAELPVRTTWLAGALDDAYVTIGRRAAAASHGRLKLIPGAGHAVHLDAPEATAEAIAEALREPD